MLGPVQNSRCFGSVLLITGPESLLAERAVTDFIAQAQAERPDAAVSRLESAELDGGTLAEATGASLFATATIAVINDLAEMPPELFDQVVELASAPGEDLALALVHGGGVKGKGLLDRVKKLHPRSSTVPPSRPGNWAGSSATRCADRRARSAPKRPKHSCKRWAATPGPWPVRCASF